MRLTFVLPGYYKHPIGGYRVHFEHANRLAARGHAVTIYMPLISRKYSGRRFFKALLVSWLLPKRPNCGIKWFAFNGPKLRLIPDYRTFWLRGESDAIIATGWQTAEFVASAPRHFGRKFYSIWDYEMYMSGEESLRSKIASTYRLGLNHITSTETINRLIISLGGTSAAIVDTGIDFDVFSMSNPPDSTERDSIGFCYRAEDFKRSNDAVAALAHLREAHPGIRIWSFGARRPPCLPAWINYYERPSDEELAVLYNKSKIFVCSSQYEGWGLPGSEAMACGAALVSTAHGGVNAYAEDQETALIVPPCQPDLLAQSMHKLLEDSALRCSISARGASSIRRFHWENSAAKFEYALLQSDKG